jgi:hypothetical protein
MKKAAETSKPKTLALRSNGNVAHTSNSSRTRTRRIARWQALFLKTLRKAPNVAHACRVAGVSRFTAYKYREEDESFARKWEESLQASVDKCEEKAFDMAWKGDSQLLQFILKAHRGGTYRETQRVDVGLLGGIVLIPSKAEGDE